MGKELKPPAKVMRSRRVPSRSMAHGVLADGADLLRSAFIGGIEMVATIDSASRISRGPFEAGNTRLGRKSPRFKERTGATGAAPNVALDAQIAD